MAVPPDQIENWWPLCAGQLALGISWTHHASLDSVHERLLEQSAQLWLAILPAASRVLCSCVTDLRLWESGHKSCRLLLVGGGRLKLWRHLLLQIEDYAREEGCDAVEVVGRKAWERIFKDDGYVHIETWIGKELTA